jgi:hypothetical protein
VAEHRRQQRQRRRRFVGLYARKEVGEPCRAQALFPQAAQGHHVARLALQAQLREDAAKPIFLKNHQLH